MNMMRSLWAESSEPTTSSASRPSLANISGSGVTGTVYYVEFGDKPDPVTHNPVTRPVSDYLSSVEADPRRAAALAAARARLARHASADLRPLQVLRLERGLSQAALAARLETSQARIARLEAGKEDMTLSFARRFAAVLQIDVNTLATALET